MQFHCIVLFEAAQQESINQFFRQVGCVMCIDEKNCVLFYVIIVLSGDVFTQLAWHRIATFKKLKFHQRNYANQD